MHNECEIVGRIGKKEIKVTKKGAKMVYLSVATNKKFKDSSGEKQDIVTWHPVHVYGKVADIAEKYTCEGDLILIKGEINYSKVENNEGARWLYSITASKILLMPNNRERRKEGAPEESNEMSDYTAYESMQL